MVAETTALGAAYLAGLATGVWNDRSEIADNWKVDARFEPATSSDEMATLLAGWKQAIERTRTNLD